MPLKFILVEDHGRDPELIAICDLIRVLEKFINPWCLPLHLNCIAQDALKVINLQLTYRHVLLEVFEHEISGFLLHRRKLKHNWRQVIHIVLDYVFIDDDMLVY